MTVYGTDYGFRFSVGAAMEIAKRCPEQKLEKLSELLNEGTAQSLDLLCALAEQCSLAYEQARAFDGGEAARGHLTREMALSLDFGQMAALSGEVMAAVSADAKTTVETEPAKKNGESGPPGKSA